MTRHVLFARGSFLRVVRAALTGAALVVLCPPAHGAICPPPPPLVLIAPSPVGAGSPNRIATIASFTGAVYTWSITNGTITGGAGTSQITFTAGTPGLLMLTVTLTLNGCPYGGGFVNATVAPVGEAVLFYPLPPCRLVDSRGADAPALAGGGGPDRLFVLTSKCGIPAGATSVSTNVTAVAPASGGTLSIYRGDGALSGTTSVSFNPGITRASDAVLQLALDGSGAVKVSNSSAGPVNLVLDVNGYFQ